MDNDPILASDSGNLQFVASGDVEMIHAAEGDENKGPPTFTMTAYTGVPMNVGFPHPVILDLTGGTTKQTIPILKDHLSDRVVGHSTSVEIDSSGIEISGSLSGANEHTREVIESAKNGFPWRASVGVRVKSREFIAAGATEIVNGKTQTGPLIVARKWTLFESSFLSLPADDDSKTKVAAQAQQENDMEFNEWVRAMALDPDALTDDQRTKLTAKFNAEQNQTPEPQKTEPETVTATLDTDGDIKAHRQAVAAEELRIEKIRKVCAGQHPEIQAKGIANGSSPESVELEVLRASRPQSGDFAIHANNGESADPAMQASVLEAAVCASLGVKSEGHYTEQVLEAADKQYRGRIGLQQLLVEAAASGGSHIRSFNGHENEVFRAAFSTTALSGIFANVANKSLLEAFDAVENTWEKIAQVSSVKDFKQMSSYRMTAGAVFDEVGPDGELKHGDLSEESFTNQAKTYGKMFTITRTDLINDDLGALASMPRQIGRGGALKLNSVFWTTYLADSAFYKAANNNYATGANTALGVDSLTAAELLFLNQVDAKSNPFSITPKMLLVPNALKTRAGQLMMSPEIRNTTSNTKDVTGNPHAGNFEVVSSSYLGASSTTAWYMLADPRDSATVDVAFLNGQRRPTVESADADFNTLGVSMRGFFDFGVSLLEHRAGVKMKGAS